MIRLTWILVLFFALSKLAWAQPEGEALHSKLVITALEYDTFNQRCRGVSAARNESKVNRLFLRKYGITLNNYIKTYLSEDARETKKQVETKVFRKIAEMGGCQQARQKGLEQQLRAEFRQDYQLVEKSTWFPEVTNL